MEALIYLLSDDRYLHIQDTDGYGYDYTIYDKNKRLFDGGILETEFTIEEAAKYICDEYNASLYKKLASINDDLDVFEELMDEFID